MKFKAGDKVKFRPEFSHPDLENIYTIESLNDEEFMIFTKDGYPFGYFKQESSDQFLEFVEEGKINEI